MIFSYISQINSSWWLLTGIITYPVILLFETHIRAIREISQQHQDGKQVQSKHHRLAMQSAQIVL